MKKLSFIAITFCAVLLMACGGAKPASQLVGSWQLKDFDLGMELAPDQKESFDAMLKQMIENTEMSFDEKGGLKAKVLDPLSNEAREETGTYSVSEDGKTLYSTSSGKTDTLTIVSLTDTEVVFSGIEGDDNMKMTFTKK